MNTHISQRFVEPRHAVASVFVVLASVACGDAADPFSETDLGVVRSALPTPQVVEAEGAIGAGATEADATASGGQLLALTVLNVTSTKAFSTVGPILSGTVRVRGVSCSPTQVLRVRVDGAVVLTTTVTQTGWTDIALSFPYTPQAGSHTMDLIYRQGTPSCKLRVDQATFIVGDPPPPPNPPVVVEAESAIGAGVVEADAMASGGQLRAFTTQYTSATASFTTLGAMVSGSVRVRATQCASTPWVRIRVDGADALLTTVPQTTWTELPLNVPALPAGNHNVEFYYRSGTTGCVLRVDQATFVTN